MKIKKIEINKPITLGRVNNRTWPSKAKHKN